MDTKKWYLLLVLILLLVGCKVQTADQEPITKDKEQETIEDVVENKDTEVVPEKEESTGEVEDTKADEAPATTEEEGTAEEPVLVLPEVSVGTKIADLQGDVTLYLGPINNLILSKKGEIIPLTSGAASTPDFSPDGTRFVYIDNVDFECIGNAHVYDSINLLDQQITTYNYGQTDTVKVAKWLDGDRLLLIIGYVYGTVSYGGSLYVYDMNLGTMDLLYQPESLTQITDVNVNGEDVTITFLTFTDENLMDYNLEDKTVNIYDLYSMQ